MRRAMPERRKPPWHDSSSGSYDECPPHRAGSAPTAHYLVRDSRIRRSRRSTAARRSTSSGRIRPGEMRSRPDIRHRGLVPTRRTDGPEDMAMHVFLVSGGPGSRSPGARKPRTRVRPELRPGALPPGVGVDCGAAPAPVARARKKGPRPPRHPFLEEKRQLSSRPLGCGTPRTRPTAAPLTLARGRPSGLPQTGDVARPFGRGLSSRTDAVRRRG
jgi:hypothetical protein